MHWILTFYQIYGLQIFSPFFRLCFHFIDGCAETGLMWSHLFILYFIAYVSGVKSKISLSKYMSRSFAPMFPSRSFLVLDLTFKFLIHFKLISVSGIRHGSMFKF